MKKRRKIKNIKLASLKHNQLFSPRICMGLTQPRLRNVETAEQVTPLIAALAPDFASIYAIPEPPLHPPLTSLVYQHPIHSIHF